MKIRTGFVSNSSSSSFIIALDKMPENAEETRKMFFPEKVHIFAFDHLEAISAGSAAQSIFDNMVPVTEEEITSLFEGGSVEDGSEDRAPDYFSEFADYHKISNEEREARYTAYNIKRRAWAEAKAKKFLEDNKGKKFFTLSYSDNDGAFGCSMEHGDAWDNVTCVRISHH